MRTFRGMASSLYYRFHVRVVADRIMTPFEFLAPEAPPATVFPQVRLPEKYRHGRFGSFLRHRLYLSAFGLWY